MRFRDALVPALAAACFALAGCATTSSPLSGSIEAPSYAVGDRWQYRVVDGLSIAPAPVTLDCEVIAVASGTTRLRVTYTDARERREHLEELGDDGAVRIGALGTGDARSFEPPVRELGFPLVQGETWRQTLFNVHERDGATGEILLYGRVLGVAPVDVPAGHYDAALLYRIVQLDDEQFWRTRTERRDQVWYSPAVRGVVREIRDGQYREKGNGKDSAYVRTEYSIYELISFKPGA